LDKIHLIDVANMSIAKCSSQVTYIALSLVWGNAKPVRLMKANIARLSKTSSLTELGDAIPRTVRDAMIFVKGIGQRYLWVDSMRSDSGLFRPKLQQSRCPTKIDLLANHSTC
jgi:hypothetical protein